jgi:hypothetical protein
MAVKGYLRDEVRLFPGLLVYSFAGLRPRFPVDIKSYDLPPLIGDWGSWDVKFPEEVHPQLEGGPDNRVSLYDDLPIIEVLQCEHLSVD